MTVEVVSPFRVLFFAFRAFDFEVDPRGLPTGLRPVDFDDFPIIDFPLHYIFNMHISPKGISSSVTLFTVDTQMTG